jgi:hypothetical protein
MAAIIALALTPVSAMLFAKLYTGAFVERYAIAAVAGVSLLVALLVAVYTDAGQRTVGILSITLFACFAISQVVSIPRFLWGRPDIAHLSLPGDGPIAITDGRVFLQMVHYCTDLRPRLYFLADHDSALKYSNSTTVDDGLTSMTSFVDMKVAPYRQFLKSHKQFAVYGPYGTSFDWLPAGLVNDGVRLQLKGRFGPYELFDAVVQ